MPNASFTPACTALRKFSRCVRPTVASLSRDGARLKFVVGRGELNADSAQPTDGHVGIGVINTGILVDRVKIVCEFDPAWLDAAASK